MSNQDDFEALLPMNWAAALDAEEKTTAGKVTTVVARATQAQAA